VLDSIAPIAVTPHELIVLKPAGLPTELPFNPEADSLLRRLELAGHPRLRLVHRLDGAACGVMLVARSPEAAAHHAAEIAARRWHKWYVARVAAPLAVTRGLVGRHKAYLKTTGRIARVVRAGGKPSLLDVTVAAPVPGADAVSDLLIRLHTGRFHQIRAMLAHRGAPLAGDVRYGGPAAPSLYLEQVMLAARPYGADRSCIWRAPGHLDRPRWDAALARALDEQHAGLTGELLAEERPADPEAPAF